MVGIKNMYPDHKSDKNKENMVKKLLSLCLLAVSFCMFNVACSDDDNGIPGLAEGEGEVVFQFVKNNTFDIDKMEDISTVKVTVEKDGVRTTLPSLKISGETDSLYSEPARLQNGTYKLIEYKVFAANASLLSTIEPEEDTFVTVEAGKQTICFFPIKIKVIYINNTIKNVLLGICKEVFGDNKTKWPWSEEVEDLADWPNLEFVTDENTGAILYLSDIIFDEKFAPMKKVPSGLSALATVEGLVFRNLDLEELPDDLGMMNIVSLTLINTKLKKFPTNLSRSMLAGLTIINSELTELPAEIGQLSETMNLLEVSGSHLKTLPAEIGKLTKLVNLRINNSELTSLPDVFQSLKKVSHMEFSNNPELSALPASIAQMRDLRGIVIDGCNFAAVPEVLKQCTLLRNLWMQNCKLTSLSATEFAENIQLEGLYLNGNKFTSFPALICPTLLGLGLNNCDLTVCPDLSGLPELRTLSLEGNSIGAVPSVYFAGNGKLVQFSLAGNPSLTSLPSDLGIALDENQRPSHLALVDVSNCPALQWVIPGNWCCMKVQSKDEILAADPDYKGGDIIIRRVNVKREGSPLVTREPCLVCGSVK